MDLKQIVYILKIAEERNITHAANKLYITQSALNQQLLKLERELGTALFYRSRSDCEPTPAGEIYIEAAKKIVLLKEEAYNKIYDIAEVQKGKLRVGFTAGRGMAMFSNVYPHYHAQYPNIYLEVNELSVQAQHDRLMQGQLDMGFMTLLKSQRLSGIQYEEIASEEIVLALPVEWTEKYLPNKEWFAQNKNPRELCCSDLALLKDKPFVLTYKTTTIRMIVNDILETAGFSPKVLFETANYMTIVDMLRAGICCSVIPTYYADFSDEKVRYYRLPNAPQWDIAVAFRKGAYIGKAGKAFIKLAGEYLSERP